MSAHHEKTPLIHIVAYKIYNILACFRQLIKLGGRHIRLAVNFYQLQMKIEILDIYT